MTTSPAPVPSPSLTRRAGTALAVTVALGVLTSCSGSSDTPEAAATSTSDPAASSSAAPPSSAAGAQTPGTSALRTSLTDFAVEMPETELEAGTYTIEVTNDGRAGHDLVVADAGGSDVAATEVLAPGASGTVEVALEPGEYSFYCSVGNHRGMGMELVVTVV